MGFGYGSIPINTIFRGMKHPFTSYFDGHQGYKVLTHCHIYRAEAGGSPEANCNLIVWIWKMLILYCVLQCFLPSLESVPSVKVSMSARINSEFVRAEK